MTDIARLAIEVDPKQLQAAVVQLEKLSVASGKAELETKKLEKAQSSASLAAARATAVNASNAAAIARASSTMSAAEKTAAASAVKQATASLNVARATDIQAAASLKAAQASLQQSQAAEKLVAANAAATGSTEELARAQDRTTRNMGRLAGQQQANMSNVAAQFQDIGVTAAMGMNPMMIGLQQGAQLTGVWGSITGTTSEKMKTFGASLMGVLSPMSLLIIGITAGLAALIQFVDWTALSKTALKGLADGLDMVAPYAFAAGAALALAFAPTILSAIISITNSIVTGFIPAIWSATTALIAFAVANPATAMILGFVAIVTAAALLNDEIKRIFGFDIIKIIKDSAEYIVDVFTAAFNTVIRAWKEMLVMLFVPGSRDSLGSVISTIFEQELGVAQKTNSIEAGIEWGKNFVSGVADSLRGMASNIGDAAKAKPAKKSSADAAAGGAKTTTTETNAEKFAKLMLSGTESITTAQQETALIGMIGLSAKTAAAEYGLLNQARSQGIDLSEADFRAQLKNKAALIGLAEQIKETKQFYQDYTDALNQSANALVIEQQALGMTETSATLYRYEQELINDAKARGIEINQQYIDGLVSEKQRQIEATAALAHNTEALSSARGAVNGFVGDMKSGLMEGKSLWETWGNAAINVLNKVIDKILTDMIDAVFQLNSASGGSGGILGMLTQAFGLISGPSAGTMSRLAPDVGATMNANSSLFAKGGAFTNSIVSQPTQFFARGGAPGIMGEAGPEAIMPLQRGPDGSLGVQMYGGVGAQPATPAVVQIVPSEYFNAVVDQRAANVSAPMVVQGSIASSKVTEATAQRRARRRIS